MVDDLPAAPPSTAEVRAWARLQGIEVSDRGRVPTEVVRRSEQAGRG